MLKKAVMILGVVFILVGILGFVNNPVLGLFNVNLLHNLIHLASGLVLVFAASRGEDASRMAARVLGVVYALVTILGFVAMDLMVKLVSMNSADNYLHILLTVVLLYLGWGASRASSSSMPQSGM